MKLQIDEIPNLEETEILIKCREIDSKITKISNYIHTSYITVNGKLDGEIYVLNLDDIYYKLQELSEMLSRTSFIQIARTIILNINKIEKVSTLVNGRISAVLVNSERMIITRVYAHAFKQKLNG